MKFNTSIDINASATTIWDILTEGSKYADWDPNMIELNGAIEPGSKLTIYTKLDPKRAFKSVVSEYEENQRMVWSSGMPLGLFKGARTFWLEPQPSGKVRFNMTEEFTGPLAGMIGKSIPNLQPSFDAFASALKERAEAR